uniref:NADH dehydrogenase subunit 3 n=1 Tax=Adiscus speciosus TaxID=2978449 RepID=UPI0021CCA571|nr:NADH dehydrogenase subunit 3 [Adiscus speciosus]UWV18190.1 NADH dehydrogenase subunit 3 [Adiscus speciosus]
MKMILYYAMMIIMILIVMVLLLNSISKKSINDREKSSPFECGFDPSTSARLPFSMQFFLIGMIFLIFDVEIALLIPLVTSMFSSNMISFSITMTLFILILILGTIHEWNQGALDWKN